MLKHTLLSSAGILIPEPSDPREAGEFEDLAREIDPYIAEHGLGYRVLKKHDAFVAAIVVVGVRKKLMHSLLQTRLAQSQI